MTLSPAIRAEQGAEQRALLPEGAPDVLSYDRVAVAFSGGKDSVACVLHLLELGVDPACIELHHHDVDGDAGQFMDWPVTPAYCRAFAAAFGLPLYFSGKVGGFRGEMDRDSTPTAPTYFETPEGVTRVVGGKGPNGTRGQFPQVAADLKVRWCSAYLKIDVMDRVICNSPRFQQGRTLVITGERAEESTARARYKTFEPHRADSRNAARNARHVDHWRPVHAWSERRVWSIIQWWGVVPHVGYQLGWSRLSCIACIFGSPNQWATLRAVFSVIFAKVAQREAKSGKTIQRKASVYELADRGTPYPAALARPDLVEIARGDVWPLPIRVDPAAWTLPAGAFGENAGPT